MKKIIILSLIILFCLKTQKVFANQGTFVVDNIEIKGEITNNRIIDRQKFLNIHSMDQVEKIIEGEYLKRDK